MNNACSQSPSASPETIRQKIAEAGQAFRKGEIDQAASILNQAGKQLQKLAAEAPNARSLDPLKPVHSALAKAHEFLAKKSPASLDAVPNWADLKKLSSESASKPDLSKTNTLSSKTVSFSQDVAPWLVTKCGKCHISDAKGGFSIENMASLMKGSKAGVVVFAGEPQSSTIVETIRSGDMPRGGGKVTPDELASLERWIQEGAVSDNPDPRTPLQQIVANKTGTPGNATVSSKQPKSAAASLMDNKPTGKETVSFSRDVAPILMANCNGCHVNAMQRRGGLNMDTFAMFSKGGDSGEIVVSKQAAESLIVQKVRGTSGQRMPAGGRPALSEANIQTIAKWIEEGAYFDGQSPNLSLETINAKAWSESASYEEVMSRRRDRALAKWKIAFGSEKPAEASDKNFVILGNISQDAIQQVLASANQANDKIRKALKIAPDAELAKGGVTIFAIKGRYDYSEFGKMTESRALPSSWNSHWRRDSLDVYIALLHDSKDSKLNESNIVQQLASIWISQFEETPNWFADGFGRGVLVMLGNKNDQNLKSQLKKWDDQIQTIVTNMKDTKDLLDGKMNEEDAAIVGYGLCRKLLDANGRRQFNGLLQGLNKTNSFPQAFQSAIGPMDLSVATTLGLATKK